jgi:hypothetical protein
MNAVVAAAQAGAGPPQVQRRLATAADEQAPNAAVRLARNVNDEDVTRIALKDYADPDRVKPLTLSLAEFLRRFRLHLLPPRVS